MKTRLMRVGDRSFTGVALDVKGEAIENRVRISH